MRSTVKVKVYAALGDASGRTIEIEVPEPIALRLLLERLAGRAGLDLRLLQGEGGVRRSFTVLVNGLSINHREGLDTIIEGGDEVALLSFVTGG